MVGYIFKYLAICLGTTLTEYINVAICLDTTECQNVSVCLNKTQCQYFAVSGVRPMMSVPVRGVSVTHSTTDISHNSQPYFIPYNYHFCYHGDSGHGWSIREACPQAPHCPERQDERQHGVPDSDKAQVRGTATAQTKVT